MKKLLIVPTLLFLHFSLYAQDWQLVNPDYHYHYVRHFSDGEVSDSLNAYSVFVDSTKGNTRYLNRLSELPFTPGEPWDEYKHYKLCQSHFLQKELILRPNGATQFQDPGNFVIYPIGTPTPWLFDSLENVLVLKDSVFQSLSYGETDSTRELILNTGDTLIFSQKFGIIRFPDGYGTQQYYQQIGITGPEKGFRFPGPKQIFSFSIGDKFEYITSNINPLTYPYNAKTVAEAYKIHQIEILDSVHLPEAIAYKTRNKILIESGSCREGYWVPGFPNGACKQFLNSNQDHFTSGPNEEDPYWTGTYEIDVQICDSVSWDTIYFSMDQEFSINFLSQYREEEYADIWKSPQIQLSYLYPGELSYLTADSWGSWREGFTDHNYSFPAYTKKPYGKIAGRMNWRSCFNSLENEKVDSVSCYYIDYGSTGYYMVDWEENLGITRAIWNPYGVEYRFVVSTDLSAYQTQFHAKGEFSPDSIFCYNPAPVIEVDGMVPYPNPASGRFSVGPFSSPRSIFVTIHNLQGVELYRNQFTIEWRWDFSLEDYLPGVYMVNIWDFEEKAWSRTRLVVQ